MKKLYIFLVIALIGFIGHAQIVNIPDANFKAKLLAADHTPLSAFAFGFDQQAFKLDVNNDGEIQVSEALLVMQLNIDHSAISDLTGIESFANLIVLNCNNNQLSNLNVSNIPSITLLQCQNNLLSSLDVSSLPGLGYLNCSDNQLTSLFIKNGNNESNGLGFSNNPNLQYICADETQLQTIYNRVTQYGYTNCIYDSNCSASPGGTFYAIQGGNRYDANNNGCDVSDVSIPNLKLLFSNGSTTTNLISTASGSYHYDVQASTQTFSLIPEIPAYFNVSPASATVTFPAVASPFVQDFCVTANGVHDDLEVTVFPINTARPGFDAQYKIVYRNKGTTIQNGSINLAFNDAVLDFVSANPTIASQLTNSLSWSFSALQPFESRTILVVLNVNSPVEIPAVNSGDVLHYTATITGNTDETPTDNISVFNQTVLNSYDPNDKTCIEGQTITPELVGEYLHYVIRFENEGTTNAQNITVRDMIDGSKFDISTLVPLSSSAACVTKISNVNKVEFVFENINLPFEAGSNTGYVTFKIKTKPGLTVGSSFSNLASIFFDFNAPIITNTYTTTIATLATQDFDFGTYFSVYPNPAKNVLNIDAKTTISMKSINIFNMLGQMIMAVPNAENVSSIDVSDLKTGTYFIKINSDKGTANTKFIKE
ncbi:T9SS type A sorting domain-containing protein [Flavobacterium sp.]|uniref:DUF7619 domain-containing protein n=1 Tax=Flavobacterium sp. TaxID=239 RepID=UPI00286C4CF6|nr:T9SS type A sorting domain-containing protein [Flavobacterium sp.]